MNWKLFSADTPVLIQGMTGKEGMRMAQWLIGSGVNVVAGVTPGKKGQEVEGRPVFNSVREAREWNSSVFVSCVVVPASRVLGAVQEAIEAGVQYITILTEHVPVHDTIVLRQLATAHHVSILGPSSVGYLQFPQFRLGYLGGPDPFRDVKEGGVAIVSTSGGMTNEMLMSLAREEIGIRFALSVGGDRVMGLTLEEAIAFAEAQEEVKLLALFVEPGRPLLPSLIRGDVVFKKSTVIFLAGEALDDLPRGVAYGHTGTVLGEDDPSVHDVRLALQAKGIACASTMREFLVECKKICLNP